MPQRLLGPRRVRARQLRVHGRLGFRRLLGAHVLTLTLTLSLPPTLSLILTLTLTRSILAHYYLAERLHICGLLGCFWCTPRSKARPAWPGCLGLPYMAWVPAGLAFDIDEVADWPRLRAARGMIWRRETPPESQLAEASATLLSTQVRAGLVP